MTDYGSLTLCITGDTMEADRIVGAINAQCAGMASLSTLKPAQPHLVPVRLGGPWKRGDGDWERWENGQFVSSAAAPAGYFARDGDVWCDNKPLGSPTSVSQPVMGAELRPPKDWTGDLPEGCCWATDFVVGQRVRNVRFPRSTGIVIEVANDAIKVRPDEGGIKYWIETRRAEGY